MDLGSLRWDTQLHRERNEMSTTDQVTDRTIARIKLLLEMIQTEATKLAPLALEHAVELRLYANNQELLCIENRLENDLPPPPDDVFESFVPFDS